MISSFMKFMLLNESSFIDSLIVSKEYYIANAVSDIF
jgi:hypothetical protein